MILLGLALACAPSVDALLAAEGLDAVEVKGAVPADAAAPAWPSIPGRLVVAAPQHTLRLDDAAANRALAKAPKRTITVRAAYDARALAVALEWADETESRAGGPEPQAFGDSAALELPERFGAGVRLPYVGMGDAEQHVVLHMVRAMEKGAAARRMVAAGYGSATPSKQPAAAASMRWEAGAWRAVFVLPLAEAKRALIPIAFAVWDGARGERGGNKALTGWKLIRLSRFPREQAYEEELAFGYGPGALPDARRGKELAEALCVACHRFGDKRSAPDGFAPDLSNIGLIASPAYLRDSILEPNRVLVPNPNPNRHYARSEPRDPNGAYPNDPAFRWHGVDIEGQPASRMAPFEGMPEQDVLAMVAYLRTLGSEP